MTIMVICLLLCDITILPLPLTFLQYLWCIEIDGTLPRVVKRVLGVISLFVSLQVERIDVGQHLMNLMPYDIFMSSSSSKESIFASSIVGSSPKALDMSFRWYTRFFLKFSKVLTLINMFGTHTWMTFPSARLALEC